MTAQILDGKAIANDIKFDIGNEVTEKNIWPHLVAILCSNDPASQVYVNKKMEACDQVSFKGSVVRLFENGIEQYSDPMRHLLDTIVMLNRDDKVHGILVQLPLPSPLDKYRVFDAIDPLKDVDVFTPENVGLLLQGRPRYIPCTPQGIQELLTRNGVQISGKKVCIINRSDIVGKPLSALLIQDHGEANATVTTCHDKTPPDLLKRVCLASDIIVVAVGIPGFLTADMVHSNNIVVDVGISRIHKYGKSVIVGDVDPEVHEKVLAYSPVPGGVGPLTVACLLRNTLKAYKLIKGMDEL